MSNGGGYGDPLEREPESALSDVSDGLVSKEAAQDNYGVVLHANGYELDMNATQRLRVSLQGERIGVRA